MLESLFSAFKIVERSGKRSEIKLMTSLLDQLKKCGKLETEYQRKNTQNPKLALSSPSRIENLKENGA